MRATPDETAESEKNEKNGLPSRSVEAGWRKCGDLFVHARDNSTTEF